MAAGALLILGLAKLYADQRQKKPGAVSLPKIPVREKLEDLGEKILGTTLEKLPKAPALEEIESKNQADQKDQKDQENQETEPIREPMENIQNQTRVLIESIKKLPEDQIEAIKEQIYKEFCERWREE